jgi:TolA protein
VYENFYHLTAKPFRLSPDPGFFFPSRGHKRALAYLRYGLSQGEGFVVITGEPGTGKTTLAQILLQEMGQSDVVVAHLTTTQLEADEMLRMVAASFGLRYDGMDKAGLLKTLEAFMLARSRERKRVLLVVDEAQNLPPRSLEELRMLSNLQVGDNALLQTFLLGQVQFRQMLDHPDLEQLRQRVIANYHLSALGPDECQDYVESRLRHVGWQDDPHFTDQAFEIIYEYTEGIPRRINMLCDRVMLFGSLEEQHEINESVLREVTDELQQEVSGRPLKPVQVKEHEPEVNLSEPKSQADSEEAAESTVSDTAPDVPEDVIANKAASREAMEIAEVVPTLEPEAGQSATTAAEESLDDIAAQQDDDEAAALSDDTPGRKEPYIAGPDDSQLNKAVPDDGMSHVVTQATPDESERESDSEEPKKAADKDRFRVIPGGKQDVPREREAEVAAAPANSPETTVQAPVPDAPGDSEEVVLRKILRLVLAFHRSPRSFPGLDDPAQPLPSGIEAILTLATSEDHVIKSLRQIAVMGISPAMLRAAVRFFVRRVLFLPGGDDYRVLGLEPSASLTKVETHYGLLMRLMRQEKQNSDDGSVARIGQSYERLCRSELSHVPADSSQEGSRELDDFEALDLDVSPTGGTSAPAQRNAVIVGDDGRTAPTGRNMLLLAGAAVIIFVLYLTQIRITEPPAPTVAQNSTPQATVTEAPAESSDEQEAAAMMAEESAPPAEEDSTQALSPQEKEAKGEQLLAQLRAEAEAEERARQAAEAKARAEAEEAERLRQQQIAEARALEEQKAREAEAARAQAKAEAEAEEKARLAAIAEKQAAEKRAAEARAAAEAKARAEAKAQAEAKARAEAKAKAEAEAKAKAEAEAKRQAELAAAKAKAATISPNALRVLTQLFESGYAKGDLDGLLALFAPGIRTNDQTSLNGVRGDYQALFSGTTERSFQFKNLRWENDVAYALGNGEYVSSIHSERGIALQSTGKVTLQLEKQADRLLITRFYFNGEDPNRRVLDMLAKRVPAEALANLLQSFTKAYEAGNIEQFMVLFAADAQSNDRPNVQGIREDYQGLFENTSLRKIDLKAMTWQWDENGVARGEGTYDVEVQANGQSNTNLYHGKLWIQVEQRDDGARITHLAFAE